MSSFSSSTYDSLIAKAVVDRRSKTSVERVAQCERPWRLRLERERKQFVKELETLMTAAKGAGFGEDELKAITLDRKGKTIVVWEFLEQERIREKLRAGRKFKPRDRYLTVLDVTNELQSRERLQLEDLQERTVFTGTEEK